jgi:hypothetical protein
VLSRGSCWCAIGGGAGCIIWCVCGGGIRFIDSDGSPWIPKAPKDGYSVNGLALYGLWLYGLMLVQTSFPYPLLWAIVLSCPIVDVPLTWFIVSCVVQLTLDQV